MRRRPLEHLVFEAARTRIEPFEMRLDLDGVPAFRTRIGCCRRRLDAMSSDIRADCLHAARSLLAELTPEVR